MSILAGTTHGPRIAKSGHRPKMDTAASPRLRGGVHFVRIEHFATKRLFVVGRLRNGVDVGNLPERFCGYVFSGWPFPARNRPVAFPIVPIFLHLYDAAKIPAGFCHWDRPRSPRVRGAARLFAASPQNPPLLPVSAVPAHDFLRVGDSACPGPF